MKPILIALLFVATAAHAGGKTTGTVTLVETMPTGVVLFTLAGTTSGQPPCATRANRYAVDLSTQAGKNHHDWLSKAYVLGKSATVIGTGSCSAGSDSEDVLETRIEQ